jgi:hypothetical protein
MIYESVNMRLDDRRQGGKASDSVYCKPSGATFIVSVYQDLSSSDLRVDLIWFELSLAKAKLGVECVVTRGMFWYRTINQQVPVSIILVYSKWQD